MADLHDSGQADSLEIEITPAMIEAGASVFRLGCVGAEPSGGGAELVTDIFEAMMSAAKPRLSHRRFHGLLG